jgi:hypothetical protein
MTQWLVNLALGASPRAVIDMMQVQSETDFRGDISAFTVPTHIRHPELSQEWLWLLSSVD